MARSTTETGRRRNLQTAAMVFGAIFVLVGVLGFVPGITTNMGEMDLWGPDSEALLLGIFQVSVLHNLVHAGLGVWGLAAAGAFLASRNFLFIGGGAYAILWLYGLLIDKESTANFVPLNNADDWLHLALAAGMILAGAIFIRQRGATTGDYEG